MGFKETVFGFAEKVGDTVNKGVKTGTDSYKKMNEKNRLKKEMTQLGTEVNNILTSVGRQLYSEEPENAKFKEVFGAVREKEERIEAIKNEIRILDESTWCKACGEMIPKTAAVCPNCGAQTAGAPDHAKTESAQPEPTVAEVVKYCENCGAELDDKAKFCPKCGTKTDL